MSPQLLFFIVTYIWKQANSNNSDWLNKEWHISKVEYHTYSKTL